MNNQRDGLPRGIRNHKSGKLIVDITVRSERLTKTFPTLEEAINGRNELKQQLYIKHKKEFIMSAVINLNNRMEKKNIGYRLTPVTEQLQEVTEQIIDVAASTSPAPISAAVATAANSHCTLTFPVTGQNVRTVVIEGKVWFVAKDVAECLGYVDARRAVYEHCKHANIHKEGVSPSLTSSPRGINIIPESDVYRLVMRSKLPTAEAFQDWVVEEVLPSLRQNGGYMMTTRPDESPEEIMARALIIAQTTITQQKQAIEVAKPIVDAHQRITQGGTRFPFSEARRALRVPMRDMHRVCSEDGILRRELVDTQYRWWPTKKAMEKGYTTKFKDMAGTWNYGFTAKGMDWLKEKLFLG